ncbi:MAG: hypothetical protein JNK26_02295 [Candidatus Doudnabacteria bacterium]|nr:hypothetical protein [Candidatus Doudnabacteria bacterium]
MLTIQIQNGQKGWYTVQVFKDKKLVATREIRTNNYLEIFESLEPLLKCCSEARV